MLTERRLLMIYHVIRRINSAVTQQKDETNLRRHFLSVKFFRLPFFKGADNNTVHSGNKLARGHHYCQTSPIVCPKSEALAPVTGGCSPAAFAVAPSLVAFR